MNETLSALIAFVGFLIVFSMLVQAVQEALKNLFKLRTGIWERFFINLYQKEFSSRKPEVIETTPFLKRLRGGEFVGEFHKRLQRIKGTVIKADELIKSVKKILNDIKNIDVSSPDANKQLLLKAKSLAESLNEILGLKLDSLLKIYDSFSENKIRDFYGKINTFAARYLELQNQIKDSDITRLMQALDDLLQSINDVEEKISTYRLQIENKIDAWIEQVDAEYKRNMQKWTVVIGFAFVLIFNADAFTIFKFLRVDSKVQTALIQKSAETIARTQEANADDLLKIESLLKSGETSEAKKEMIVLFDKLQKDFMEYGAIDEVNEIETLRKEIKEKSETPGLLNQKQGDIARLFVELQKRSIAYQLEGISSLDLPLGWTEDWKKFISAKCDNYLILILLAKKVSGLTLTAFLITFGAPFWNDILGALSGLKGGALKKR